MNLKRVKYPLIYHENKISEYTLLTEYNPKFINTKIKAITMQIEMMYHLNISHMTTSEVHGVITISYPLEVSNYYYRRKGKIKVFQNEI